MDYLKSATNYNTLWNPDYEAYNNFNYHISAREWDELNQPWQFVNRARVFQIMQGNIILDTYKDVMHDFGYDKRMSNLYTVFKLNPSLMDAFNLLTNPIDSVSRRLLPPANVLVNLIGDTINNGGDLKTALKVQSWLSLVPSVGALAQRAGINSDLTLAHNNAKQRIEDAGWEQAVTSLFTAAYEPHKKYNTWYGRDGEYMTKLPTKGFTPNYYATRYYSDPYTANNPTYRITQMARNTKPKALYAKSKRINVYNNYSDLFHNQLTDNQLKKRVIDKYYYY